MTQTRHHRIKSDYGVRDFYKSFRAKGINPSIDDVTYCTVLKDCLDEMTELVINKNFT